MTGRVWSRLHVSRRAFDCLKCSSRNRTDPDRGVIIRSGEGVIPIVGVVKVIVERTAKIVSVEVVVRGIEVHGLDI